MTLSVDIRGRAGPHALEVALTVGSAPLLLMGRNGAGKSTLLRMLLGVHTPTAGTIRLGDRTLFDASAGIDVPCEARGIGWVPQQIALFPHLTAAENVAWGLPRTHGRMTRAELRARARGWLDRLEVGHVHDRRPAQLSGGEKQRVALARALAAGPRALLLDEPLSSLDVETRAQIRAFLAKHLATLGLPTLLVLHDPLDARALDYEIVVMEQGRIVQRGTFAQLSQAPATAFVRALTTT